jgi:tetratricopeptide (TPR) repeat protein
VTPLRRTVCTLALLAAPVATALLLESPAAEAAAALAETGDSGNAFSPNRALAANFVAAARAARGNDFAAAAKALAPQLAGAEPEASRARVVLGLLAAEKDRADEAQRLLAKGPGPLALEDLRLFALAEGAAGRGATSVAWAALEELLRAVPESPLRRASLLKLAELAFADSKVTDALAFIEQGRDPAGRKALTAVEREQFDSLAWKIGSATGNPAVQREAARRLLVDSPLAAARLEVAGALVAQPQGDWRTALSTADLLARAAALLQVAVPQGALTTLEAVPLTDRDFDWSLLRARALTAAQRGSEALTELSQAEAKHAAGDPLGRLELERAHAYWDVVAVRRGRPPCRPPSAPPCAAKGLLPCAVPSPWRPRQSSRRWRCASSTSSSKRRARSTRRSSCSTGWRRSRPGDVLGARPLWERGWREYQSGNWSGAVGYWSELRDLYPAISYARSAQYWSGRAYEKLGDRERSLATFADLTRADTADFYSRQASLRLAGAPPTRRSRPRCAARGLAHRPRDRAGALAFGAGARRARRNRARTCGRAADARAVDGAAGSHPRPVRGAPREPPRAAQGVPSARHRPPGDRPARGPRALLPPALFRSGVAAGARAVAAAVAGLRDRPPGERFRSGGEEPLGSARTDAAHAFDRQRGRPPAGNDLLDPAAIRAGIQFAPRYDILPSDARDIRQSGGARAGGLQRRTGSNRASLARTAVSGRDRSLPRGAFGRRIAQLRETNSRLAESYRSLYSDLS